METQISIVNTNKAIQSALMLMFSFGGFFPVCSIILHCVGVMPLHQCLFFLVVPTILLFIFFGMKFPEIGRTVLVGFLAGIIAVFFYDLSRLPYILAGWSDFIPKIGAWVTNTNNESFLLGYTWRYLGNGGGMGVAFFILISQLKSYQGLIFKGLLFGLFVFTGLMLVLCFFEHTQSMMFKITPLSFTGSITGHIIYGLVLGFIAKKYFANASASVLQ